MKIATITYSKLFFSLLLSQEKNKSSPGVEKKQQQKTAAGVGTLLTDEKRLVSCLKIKGQYIYSRLFFYREYLQCDISSFVSNSNQ